MKDMFLQNTNFWMKSKKQANKLSHYVVSFQPNITLVGIPILLFYILMPCLKYRLEYHTAKVSFFFFW